MSFRFSRALTGFLFSLSVTACAGATERRTIEVAPSLQAADAAPAKFLRKTWQDLPSAPIEQTAQPIRHDGPAAQPDAPISECQANFEDRIADALRVIEQRRRI